MTDNTHGQVPEALRLADEISKAGAFPAYPRAPYEAAAAELRRLHAQAAALTAAPQADSQPAPATQQAGDLARLLKEILADACHYESETNLRAELYQRLYDAHAALTATPQPTPPAQAAESVLEDAARWQWLADYLIGERTDLDEGIVACATIDALRQFADAARKQGANHD